MTKRLLVMGILGLFSLNLFASQTFTKEQATKIVQPFYDFLSHKTDATQAKKSFHKEWLSYDSENIINLDSTFSFLENTLKPSIPDLNWQIKDLFVSGNTIIVRAQASGTPKGTEFLGYKIAGGKSFKIMSIDIHTVKEGKLITEYHIEDWYRAINQIR